MPASRLRRCAVRLANCNISLNRRDGYETLDPMRIGRSATPWVACVLGTFTVVSLTTVYGQSAAPRPARAGARQSSGTATAAASAPAQRALLDQYCVTCHNDRTRTANLSLEKLDLATAGDHPELWEKVVRKLRAGVMPPPDVRRPPLAEYEALRDWL